MAVTDPAALRTATLWTLGRRLVRAMLAHKGLVISAIAAAALHAFFSKAPYLLLKPLSATLDPRGAASDGAFDPASIAGGAYGEFEARFSDFALWLTASLGIGFEEAAESKSVILACAAVAATAGILGGVALYFSTLLSRFFAAQVVVDLRNEIAEHLLLLPLRYFGRQRMGDLISRLTNNTNVLNRAFEMIADRAMSDPFSIVANVLIVAFAAPELLLVFLPLIPTMGLPMIRLGRKVHRRSGRSLAAMGDATESMNQMLSGIKTVKAFQLERQQLDAFRRSNAVYLKRTRRMLQAKGRSQGIVFVGYQVGFAAMIVLLGWLILTGERKVGDLAVTLAAIATTYTHVKRLARTWNTSMESLGALEAVEEILAEWPDAGHRRRGRTVGRIGGHVAMENVSFAYGAEPVLRDVSFEVPAGTTVALVGPSGAGKSTLVDLLARFHDPTGGRVIVDGQDLRDIDVDSYRRNIAMVVQQPFLFNTTIEENIRYGRPDASQEEIEAAARAALVDDFVRHLREGYDTVVGERGSNLSGGQMQRITIARALLRDPAILFLDEATSALDSESELMVQRALERLMRGRTSFVIAHRLSTIRDADLILVMAEGQIVERGRHDELLEAGGLYRRLIDLQQVGV